MNLNGWATKLLSIVLIQDWYPCCVLSGHVVPLIFLSLSLHRVERVLSCLPFLLELWGTGEARPYCSVLEQRCCAPGIWGSEGLILGWEGVLALSCAVALLTEWIPWRHDHPVIPHEPGGLLISEWKILPMLIVYWSLIQNVNITVLSNVAILFLLSVLWKTSVLILLWILYHSVCTAHCCLTFYGALRISSGSFLWMWNFLVLFFTECWLWGL